MHYIINEAPDAAAKAKGHATYPDDFPRLREMPGQDFLAWAEGSDWHVETTLTGDALFQKLRTLPELDEAKDPAHTKRVIELANKLRLKENAYCTEHLPGWVRESEDWARKMLEQTTTNMSYDGLCLKYILNHLCPNLYHFVKIPNPRHCDYAKLIMRHNHENAQVTIHDDRGVIVQEGVNYDTENLKAFLDTAIPICRKYFDHMWEEASSAMQDGRLAKPWHSFKAGTRQAAVWHWFQECWPGGTVSLSYMEAES